MAVIMSQRPTSTLEPASKTPRVGIAQAFRRYFVAGLATLFPVAVNVFTGQPGTAIDQLDHQVKPIPQVARHYKAERLVWAAVGDENYGEGSSREHAAMSPRYLGCRLVIAKGFARLHITNLKKQGVLPCTFADPADYDEIQADDRISIHNISMLAPNAPLRATLHHADGRTDTFQLLHSMTEEQIRWFRAGAALNLFRT